MGTESDDFEHVQALILTELENKQRHYRTKAWRTPLLWIVGGAVYGLVRDAPGVGLVTGVVVGGLWSVYHLRQASKDPRKAPILDLLRTRAHDIVWIYWRGEHREESAVIILGLADGTRDEVPVVGNPEELDRIMEIIARRAPWATVGFHHEHERRYFENPASLRREPRSAAGAMSSDRRG